MFGTSKIFFEKFLKEASHPPMLHLLIKFKTFILNLNIIIIYQIF